ncbi:hypothetical protein F4861DRAFT_501818 [Xylaria intraflava]|nr:hypothetical protein F4861DRAFT_501818 [Xylaria intraflava]
MACVCRTKSLRIFVQSLTDLHVTHPAISIRHPSRLFSSSSAAYFPRQKWREVPNKPSVGQAEEGETSRAPVDTVAKTQHSDVPPSPLLASDDDLAMAKINGAILEYNPDSIESLATDLGQLSMDGEERNNDDPNTKRKSRERPKPPVVTSQLKRLRIIKDEPQDKAKINPPRKEHLEPWEIQKRALKEKFPDGWKPRKRVSPDAMSGIKALHAQFPQHYTTPVLAELFGVSAEAIRRILRSNWRPSAEEEEDRQNRWFNRGKGIWTQMAELGMKPPRRWRREGIVRAPHWNEKKGPRTEYPYVPRRSTAESTHRKLSGGLV